jgi:adenylate cyclase
MAPSETDKPSHLQQTSPAQRRLAAVLAADVVGYSRLMEADEAGTHARLMRMRASILDAGVAAHHGQIIKNTGDGFLAMFASAQDAIGCAIGLQRAVLAAEAGEATDRRICFRMGVNVADVLVEKDDIYGAGVNIAARLQTHAEAGGIAITGAMADELGGTMGLHTVDLGEMQMRNLAQPVRVLSLRLPEAQSLTVGEVEHGHEARPSIAVLPFRKLEAGDDSYFADGFVDNIIHALAALKELFVISRGSTLGFGSGAIDVRAIGRALSVRYVLYGSVQRSGDRLRIGTELSDAETGEVMRADHYDGDLGELFQLQDRIAEEVVKTIAPRVRERELKRALRKHPQNMTAYDLVLQALDTLYRLDYATFSRARGLLQRAMINDPTYAPAFSYAAYWHCYRIGQEWSPDGSKDAAEALRLSTEAIERDAADAVAWAIYGHAQSFVKKDFEAAVSSFDRAIDVCPNSAMAWTFSAATFCYLCDGPGAVRRAEAGLRLSPVDAHIFFAEHILSQAHYVNGDFENAVAWGRRAAKRNNRLASNLRSLAASLVAIGSTGEAREVALQHMRIVPEFSLSGWKARTPLQGNIRDSFVERLHTAGFPD